jgi:scyllo-inositol 2-dehydrogenase (NADP+)
MIRTCIVGFGLSGQFFHYPFISQMSEFDLVYIVSSRKLPQGVKKLESIEQACDKEDIDLIVLAGPNHLHYQHCRFALEAKKHVLVEKPFVETSAQAKELKKIAQENNVKLCVYHNRRFDGDFLSIQKLINEQSLGKLVHFESHFDRFRPEVDNSKWREGDGFNGGIFFDLGPHLIDQILFLFGKPNKIHPIIKTVRDNAKANDYFHITFEYDKLTAIAHASALSQINPSKFLIHGSKGSFISRGLDQQENQLRLGMPFSDPDFGSNSEITAQLFDQNFKIDNGNYHRFYQQLALAITKDLPLPIDTNSAIQTVEVMEEILRLI